MIEHRQGIYIYISSVYALLFIEFRIYGELTIFEWFVEPTKSYQNKYILNSVYFCVFFALSLCKHVYAFIIVCASVYVSK